MKLFHSKAEPDTVSDPVCGMALSADAAKFTSVRGGATYHFCSPSCKSRFDADPEKYVPGKKEDHRGHGCCG